MPSRKMSVRLFEVVPDDENHPLQHVLAQLEPMTLGDRLRTLADGKQIRAEIVELPTAGKPYWLLDFTRLRFEHGPGRASANRPIQGFALQRGEGFGEETAVLYHPRSRSLVLQTNQFGVRQGALEDYFSMIIAQPPVGYRIAPVLDPTVAAKLVNADRFTRFTLKVVAGNISQQMRRNNVSLNRALEIGDQFHAPEVEITLGVGHSRTSLSTGAVRSFIELAKRLIRERGDSVLQAEVQGRNSADPESKSEVLDLITPTLREEFADLELGGDLRFTRESRFRALERAFTGWRGAIRER
jgi:hypothetical protein